MSTISAYSETAMINHIFNKVAANLPAAVFVGLMEGDPGNDGSAINEPVGNGYARPQVTLNSAVNRNVQNPSTVSFPQATGPWQTTQLDYYGIFDAVSGGNFLAYAPLVSPQTVISGNTPTMAGGEVSITLLDLATKGTQSNISTAAANLLLNHLFGIANWGVPDTYLGYSQQALTDDTTGSTVVEPGAPENYSRLRVWESASANTPKWELATANVVRNADQLIMPAPSGSWGTLTANFVADNSASGNILFYDNAMNDQLVGLDDTLRIIVNAFNASIT